MDTDEKQVHHHHHHHEVHYSRRSGHNRHTKSQKKGGCSVTSYSYS